MTFQAVRVFLVSIFLVCFVVCCVITIVMYYDNAFYAETLQDLMLRLFGAYSIHISVVIAGMFATKSLRPPAASLTLGLLAVVLVAIWNALVVGRVIAFLANESDSAASLIAYFDSVISPSAFLISGVLTFFFVKHS